MERWSYKPEVEGLNPSLGTSSIRKLSGRDSSWQNEDCPWTVEFAEARRPHAPSPI